MPISEIQAAALKVIAKNRSLDSYLAGATLIHAEASSPRVSQDLDIFHDDPDLVPRSARADAASLQAAGFTVEWIEQFSALHRALVRHEADTVEIDWAADSAYRFFPLESDPTFGFRLHPIDAATNKVLAFVGRFEIRDLVDCLYLHQHLLSLGALVWAACGKDEGFTPDRIINEGQRRARFHADDLKKLHMVGRTDPVKMRQEWEAGITQARRLADSLPPQELGCLYLDESGKAVTPNPQKPGFDRLRRHRGSLRGVLPVVHEPRQKS